MERSNRSPVTGAEPGTPGETSAALSDAEEIAQRAAADELAAAEARDRFRREGLPRLEPEERIRPLLDPGEQLIAVHAHALLERREPSPGDRLTRGLVGDLYVTARRLILVGRLTLSFDLDALDDYVVAGERLLVVLRDGHGLALQVTEPRVLSVEIAAARATARAAGYGSGSCGEAGRAR